MDSLQQKPGQRVGAVYSTAEAVSSLLENGVAVPWAEPGGEQWQVDGMHCAGCAARLEGVLRGVPGVGEAEVNYATGLATVRWRTAPSKEETSEQRPTAAAEDIGERTAAVVAAIEKAGFAAESCLLGEPPAGRHDGEVGRGLRRFLWAAAGFLPLFVGTMGAHLRPHSLLAAQFQGRLPLEALLSGGVLFFAAASVLRAAWGAVRRRAPDMDFLVGTGAVLAWGGECVCLAQR